MNFSLIFALESQDMLFCQTIFFRETVFRKVEAKAEFVLRKDYQRAPQRPCEQTDHTWEKRPILAYENNRGVDALLSARDLLSCWRTKLNVNYVNNVTNLVCSYHCNYRPDV
jgi:hypothetical protein